MKEYLAKTKSFEQHCYFVDLAKELAILKLLKQSF